MVEPALTRRTETSCEILREVLLANRLFARNANAIPSIVQLCKRAPEVIEPGIAPEREQRIHPGIGMEQAFDGVRTDLEVVSGFQVVKDLGENHSAE